MRLIRRRRPSSAFSRPSATSPTVRMSRKYFGSIWALPNIGAAAPGGRSRRCCRSEVFHQAGFAGDAVALELKRTRRARRGAFSKISSFVIWGWSWGGLLRPSCPLRDALGERVDRREPAAGVFSVGREDHAVLLLEGEAEFEAVDAVEAETLVGEERHVVGDVFGGSRLQD